jgi:tRNA-dihydrouridine synthase C
MADGNFMSFPSPRAGRPSLCLAPMEGVTDAPMRSWQSRGGAFAYCVSEFLRVSQEIPPAHVFLRHVPELAHGCRTSSGVPVQIQLLGGDPGKMARAALVAVGLGAPAIDINFGCPAPTVNRHDGGATLLKYPARIREIVQAIREAVPEPIPVSAKLRLGWDNLDAVDENAAMAEAGGASWITIHGRTRIAGYAPPVYWAPIGRVRRALRIPVVANGDIWTLEDFERCRSESECEHFMLGRGALADPSLPAHVARRLGLSVASPEPSGEVPFGTARDRWSRIFASYADEVGPRPARSEHIARRCKQWIKMAARGRGIEWFDEVKRFDAYEDIVRVLGAPA